MSEHHSKRRHGALQTYVEGFLQDLDQSGYKKRTQKHYRADVRRFITYSKCHGIYTAKQFVARAHKLVRGFPGSEYARRGIQASVNRFVV